MAVAFQLSTNTTLLNLSARGDMVDLCHPDKGERNLLLRGGIFDDVYLGTEKVEFDFQLGYLDLQTADNARLTAEAKGIKLEKTFKIYEHYISKTFKFSNTTDNQLNLSVISLADIDFGSNFSRDTAVNFPLLKAIVHYEDDQYLAIFADRKPQQFAIQANSDFSGRGAAPDKNLELTGNPVGTGKVQSCLKYQLEVAPQAQAELNIYYLFGKSYADLIQKYRVWEKLHAEDQAALNSSKKAEELSPKVLALAEKLALAENEAQKLDLLYKVSRNLVAGSFTKLGGNFAAVDSSYFKGDGVDDYSYFWPRDGALVLWALLKEKDQQVSAQLLQNFFNYVAKCFAGQPYLLHRYRLTDSASLASSWHVWANREGTPRLPLQLDQTALIAFVYGKYLRRYQNRLPQFEELLEEVAIFLLQQIEPSTGLHLASYDLWENDWGQFLSTQASVIAALKELQYIFSTSSTHKDHYQKLTNQLESRAKLAQTQLSLYFYPKLDSPLRGNLIDDYGDESLDNRADASLHWLWQLGVLPPAAPELEGLVEFQAQKLAVGKAFARYEGDHYLAVAGSEQHFPGNPWYISTLWFAQYYLLTGKLDKARAAVSYVLEHMDQTGLLPEMADPNSGYALSVKPLIWSHAEVLNLLNWNVPDNK